MTEDDVKNLISQKKLALVDFSISTIVKPTGRYMDAFNGEKLDIHIANRRWSIEVKDGLFSKRWVSAFQLKIIKVLEKK